MRKFHLIIIVQLGVIIYICTAPFNPVIFFSIGAISVAGLIWTTLWPIRKAKNETHASPIR